MLRKVWKHVKIAGIYIAIGVVGVLAVLLISRGSSNNRVGKDIKRIRKTNDEFKGSIDRTKQASQAIGNTVVELKQGTTELDEIVNGFRSTNEQLRNLIQKIKEE